MVLRKSRWPKNTDSSSLRWRWVSAGHHTIDRLKERGVKTSLKELERASSIMPTVALFQGNTKGNFYEGLTVYWLPRAHRHQLEPN